MDWMEWTDRSVLEATSWRLASELLRRHPKALRLIRGHPAGGQSDVLWLLPRDGGSGDIRLNREGTIQVLDRFDGRPAGEWQPTEWDDYLRSDPRAFLDRLERAAGLPAPAQVPAATPTTLVCRVLAAIAATAVKTVHPIDIQMGIFDSSGMGAGPNDALIAFRAIPRALLESRTDDFYGQPGYRFWIVLRDRVPLLAFEHEAGLAWTPHHAIAVDVMELYRSTRRQVLITALTLLRDADVA